MSVTPAIRRISLVLLVALWLLAFAGTHVPAGDLPRVGASDKTLHAAAYFVLAGCFWAVLALRGAVRKPRAALVLCCLLIYAAIDEATQPLVHRHASALDWLADAVGVAAAVTVAETIAFLRRRAARD